MSDFLSWFKNAGGTLSPLVGITEFPGMSRGAIALDDIEEGFTLFTIPRNILLSTRTTELRKRLGEADWAALGSGWQPLIVSMMWEESRGNNSLWDGYLRDLPNQFDTLMFWSEEELIELQASTIKDKIGRADAERDYLENVYPIICRRSDVFDPALLGSHFSGERFHINGSRILSRSFHVEEWETEQASDHDGDSNHGSPANDNEDDDTVPTLIEHVEAEPSMEVDGNANESDEDEDKEQVDDVAMVPMADILNARYGCENAKLFYEKDVLRMISTKDIARGDQIWNTYGDPPNADLLRRYGHVDLIPMDNKESNASSLFPYENPADEVEIRADLLLDICLNNASESEKSQRTDVWLSLGGDDTFAIDKSDLLCKDMLGMIKYLSMTDEEVQDAVAKDKLPKGKPSGEILAKAIAVFQARLSQYTSSIEGDEGFLSAFTGPPNRLFNATFVRLCEKRLLKRAIEQGEAVLAQEGARSKGGKAKRPREEERELRRDRKKIKK